ncbi:SusC/RagA family TonB-linked outer membrane protein [Prevotella sp.]|uniref:SusC/RagA family TonB-linked outer membrane protein n=1 Tax=Prevotella sp. TaxID=59823 RepID=UPI002F932381
MEKKLLMLLVGLFCCIGAAMAQTRVTGTVVSQDDGEPVIGASVTIQGTKTGAVTDIDGRFTLTVPAGAKLVFSYIGMKSQTLAARNGMKVSLVPDNETLDEVVVTGMMKVDKRLFTGATTKLDANKAKLDGVADISRSLEGRAAGVSVQNVSGTFGTAPKIRVRGATSIYGSSKPLWVVDGVIQEDVVNVSADELSSGDASTLISSAIAGLNSDDIESFQILKDGSATSIYGARAMAGVIVITTKKGKAGQAHINYTGEFTLRLIPSYSTFNIMNSQDQMSVYQELEQKGFLSYSTTSNRSEYGIYGKMYDLLTLYDVTSGQFGLANTQKARNAYLRSAEYRNTDWFGELFNTNVMSNHSVSISGGTERAQFYGSVSAMIDPGWTLQSKVQRYTANFNSTYRISNKLTTNIAGNASFRKQRAPGTLASVVDDVNGTVNRDFDINPYSYALNTSRCLDPDEYYTRNYAPFNIKHELANNYMDLGVQDFRGQIKLDYKPVKKLELSLLAAVKYSGTSQEHFIHDHSNQSEAYRAGYTTVIRDNNPFFYKDPLNAYDVKHTVLNYGGIFERTDRSIFGWDMRASLQYNDVFNNDHIVNFYGGLETNSNDRHNTWFRGWGMQYDAGEIANYNYEIFKKGAEENTEYYTLRNYHTRSAAFFANATYSWKGRYTINGTYRYEGTNGLGKNRSSRWLPTWNIAGTWNAHEEPWFRNVFKGKLSHLTLKASYSLTADRPAVTNAAVIIRSNNPWRPSAGIKETSLYQSSPANQDLTYEKKHELNLGLEAGFLNNRINFALDWYKRNNYDLIGPTVTQGTSGSMMSYGNIASMKSDGVEVSLSTTNIKTKNFSWTTSFIYSHTHNEVTKLETSTTMMTLISGNGFTKEGYPVRCLFSVPFRGLNHEGIPTFLDQDGNVSTTGIYFQTSDPDKLGFLKYEGSTEPTETGSLGNIFKYKGFMLNVFVTYSFGNVVRLDPVFRSYYSDLTSTPKEFKNRWTVPGDENTTSIPVIANQRQRNLDSHLGYAYSAYNYSTERIAKGDFIRMKEISLGYDFPKPFCGRLGLNTLGLKLQATNLFLIYADKKLNGQDPEFFNTGGVAAPMPKQFTLTLRLGI